MANLIGTGTTTADPSIMSNTGVIIASDGTACVVWHDGTNQNFSYAAAPYTSWTTHVLQSGDTLTASIALDTNDNAWVISNDPVNGATYYPLTKSGSTFSRGTPTVLSVSQINSNTNSPMCTIKDPHGRYWAICNDTTRTQIRNFESSTPSVSSSWSSVPIISSNGNADSQFPCSALVGSDLVIIWKIALSGSAFEYSRLDVSASKLASRWATPIRVTTPSGVGLDTCFRGNPSGIGLFAYPGINGNLYSMSYTLATDTWGTEEQFGTSAHDVFPSLISVGNDFYCFWRMAITPTTHSLVYKKWSGTTQTWDALPTTLVPGDVLIDFLNTGLGNTTLGVAYAVSGTPYSLFFETVTI